MGGFHVDNSTNHFGSAVGWGSACLAIQPIVGLLPERRLGSGGRCFACAASGRATLDFQLLLFDIN